MKFTDYYKSLVNKGIRQRIRARIIETTGIQVVTFYGWLYRGYVPKHYHNTIAEIVGLPKTELFPETN